MENIKAVTEHLFSRLEEKNNYPYESDIKNALKILKGESEKADSKNFFEKAACLALKELSNIPCSSSPALDIDKAFSEADSKTKDSAVLKLMHPESAFFPDNRTKGVEEIRKRRKIRLTKLNSSPLKDPAKQIIFTSNLILTVPSSMEMLKKAQIPEELKKEIKSIMNDSQEYWFDHPVPLGIPEENNELIYGLKNLAKTLEYEKKHGSCAEDSKLTVIISVSVTHGRLKNILHAYMKELLKKSSDFKGLNIYVFTENDTDRIMEKILKPAAKQKKLEDIKYIKEVFGVDGKYGRHYSFLKAISPLFQILYDKDKTGTFKIDLDQVFPEKELVRETGKSAFCHLMTPLWGAEGRDWKNRKVELGMIAGSLVNEKDIKKSFFYPDVPYPETEPRGEERVFFKHYPMALSTEAEMDVRTYKDLETCQMRYHVTGGTNGILNKYLRKYRPFTPSFIGRAEDQGYILSVIFSKDNPQYLRYLHQPGFKMRHDKEAFISDIIKSSKTAAYIGDLVRILAFSSYSDIVEGGTASIKEETDPFTGSFISKIPCALVLFKLLMHISDELEKDKEEEEKHKYIENLVQLATERLNPAFDFFKDREKLAKQFKAEKKGWNIYYDILDYMEESGKSEFSKQIKKEAEKIFSSCKM